MIGPIVIEAVRRAYGTRTRTTDALGPLSVTLEPGVTTAIVGPSGCGKSTLLRILGGMDQPTAGSVTIAGEPARPGMPGLGIVFQRDLLLDWRTVLGNVLLAAEFAGLDRATATARAHTLLAELGVGGFEDQAPWQLSGGMRQRVAIARALLCEPTLLLLDEPFSALDAITRDNMGVLLQRVQHSGRTTTLLVTHSIPEAVLLADRVLVMSPRPGCILDDIAIPLPRPRPLALRETPDFTALVRRIRTIFEQQGVLAA